MSSSDSSFSIWIISISRAYNASRGQHQHTLFLLLGLLLGGSSTTGSGTTSGGSTTSTTAGDGGKLGGTLSDQLRIFVSECFHVDFQFNGCSYLVDILALELRDEGL
ncbi:hypothetical protein RRF57_008779 [Xylaria bambusicola]|uniref:Secreted protein n=1 Tax=Xylaria bambusicola TaxID=326684 RepID=A0AAN7Z108_9PEZI